ncbi:MAG: hypothetical protein Q8936_23150 [Bacillota bacterium]|nr:hypothetical protein [Bacillota bacterium]
MRLDNGEIIAGERVGNIYLGWNFETLKKYIGDNYEIEERANCKVIKIDNAMFWINNSNEIYQIMVFGEFYGKFSKTIGIGSTLSDVEKHVGGWKEDMYIYIIPTYYGICFELKDADDWDELNTPIEYISIYS